MWPGQACSDVHYVLLQLERFKDEYDQSPGRAGGTESRPRVYGFLSHDLELPVESDGTESGLAMVSIPVWMPLRMFVMEEQHLGNVLLIQCGTEQTLWRVSPLMQIAVLECVFDASQPVDAATAFPRNYKIL